MAIEAQIRNVINRFGHISVDHLMQVCLKLRSNQANFKYQVLNQTISKAMYFWCDHVWKKLKKPSFNLILMGFDPRHITNTKLECASYINKVFFLDACEIPQNLMLLEEIKSTSIIISNEFFGKMPIKQFVKSVNNWYETILVLDQSDGRIKFDKLPLIEKENQRFVKENANASDGTLLEESTIAVEYMQAICNIIQNYNGAALIIDYYIKHKGISTLKANVDNHYNIILETLGEAILSASVCFDTLSDVLFLRGFKNINLIKFGSFLAKLNIQNTQDNYLDVIEII